MQMNELKKYTAVMKDGCPIVSVSAACMEDGRTKIKNKLSEDRHKPWSDRWVRDGELVIFG